MNIIELVKQAGLGFLIEPQWICQDELEAFAKLVAAHERDACAKIAEIAEPYQAADLIRARSNT